MTFEDMDMDDDVDVNEPPPPEDSSNRTFLLVVGILGGIMLLTLIILGVYALIISPFRESQRATQAVERNAQNTQIAMSITQTSVAKGFTDTPTVTSIPPTATATATATATTRPTQVVAVPTEVLVTFTPDPRTATVAALLTQAASSQGTMTPTSTGLPQTGFADEVGVPGLLGLALALIVVIFLARRLRTAS